jgi:hypothetical protein
MALEQQQGLEPYEITAFNKEFVPSIEDIARYNRLMKGGMTYGSGHSEKERTTDLEQWEWIEGEILRLERNLISLKYAAQIKRETETKGKPWLRRVLGL